MRQNGASVCVAMTRPRMFAGVDYRVAAIIWGPLGWLALVFNDPLTLVFIWLGSGILLHMVFKVITKREPLGFAIYKKYMHQGDYYIAWPMYRPKRGLRPIGFGRSQWKG